MTSSRLMPRRTAVLAVLAVLASLAVVQITTRRAEAAPIVSITPNNVVNTTTGTTRLRFQTTSRFVPSSEQDPFGIFTTPTVVTLTRRTVGSDQPSGDTLQGDVVEPEPSPGNPQPPSTTVLDVDFNFLLANPGTYDAKVQDDVSTDTCTACFSVVTPTGAPTLTSVNPTTVSAGTTTGPHTLTGSNFANGTRVEVLLDNAVDTLVTFSRSAITPTSMSGSFRTSVGTPPGFRSVRVVNVDGRSGICSNCLVVSGINVTDVTPRAATDQETRRLTITGTGFPAGAVARLVKETDTGQAEVPGGNTVVTQPSRLEADFDFRGVQLGFYRVRVIAPDGSSNNIACSPRFEVIAAGTQPQPQPSGSPTTSGTCATNPSGNPTPSGTPVSPSPSATSASPTSSPSPTPPSGAGRYVAVNPDRTLDTRAGIGSITSPLGPRETRSFQVTGRSGIPSGATAVTFNLTVARPSAASFVTAFPAGQVRPTASNLNFVRGETIANLVTVPIGSGGQVSLYNSSGTTDLIADVVGYYGPASGGAAYSALNPERILDSRDGNGTTAEPFGPSETRQLQITGRANVPANATAVAFNLTAITPTAAGFLTAYPSGGIRPTASNLNFVKGDVIANLVVVRIGTGGQVSIFNNSGATDVAADIVGYFSDTGGAAALYTPLSPERFLDTRDGTGGLRQRIGPGESRPLQITGRGGIPANATAVTFNLTAVTPSSSGFFTAYPSGTIRPTASNVNFVRGDVIANLVIVRIGSGGRVDIFNNSGFADAVADVVGYYVAPAPSPTPTATASGTATPTSSTTATPTATASTTATPTATPSATASTTATPTATASTSATATPTSSVTPTTTPVAAKSSTDAPTGMLLGLGLFVLFGATSSAAAAAYAGRGYRRQH